ncbi:MAG: hypothetical protein ACRDRH_06350 [Pseudonocardia sp.]
MLREQIRNEFTASQQYTAVAVHLDGQVLPQFRFLEEQVEEVSSMSTLLTVVQRAGQVTLLRGVVDRAGRRGAGDVEQSVRGAVRGRALA